MQQSIVSIEPNRVIIKDLKNVDADFISGLLFKIGSIINSEIEYVRTKNTLRYNFRALLDDDKKKSLLDQVSSYVSEHQVSNILEAHMPYTKSLHTKSNSYALTDEERKRYEELQKI